MATTINASKTAYRDLKITQGDTLNLAFQYVTYSSDATDTRYAIDLSSYDTCKVTFRKTANGAILLQFTNSDNPTTVDISRFDEGVISINTSPIELAVGQYVYDVEVSNEDYIGGTAGEIRNTILAGRTIIVNQTS